MPARHKARPFWAQAVTRKLDYVDWFCTSLFDMWQRCGVLERVQSSDGRISLPPTIARNVDLIIPRVWPPSQQAVSNGWIPNKNLSPIGGQLNLHCAMMCDANFPCCLQAQYDQGFTPAACVKIGARSFQ